MKALVILSVFLIGGCCALVPCHPGSNLIGHVTDLNGRPIDGAIVTLYNSETVTDTAGCFQFELADALPFELTASAPNYKSIKVERKVGFYQISIQMAPQESSRPSKISWNKLDAY